MMNISDLIKDTIVSLCRANGPYNGRVEIDGIICISGPKEGQQLVIKVHECLEAYVKESVETWMNKKTIRDDVDQLWMPSVKSEATNLSRLRPDGDREGMGVPLEMRNGKHESLVQASKDSNFDGSLVLNLENGDKRFNENKDCHMMQSLECKLCLKSFIDQESIEVHNELCHNLFTCQSCLKTFTSRSNLERHSRLHTGHKPYICTICDKAFSRKDHLSNHMTKHAFKCSACSKKFADCISLASHFSYDHRLTLTHVCQLCNEGFGSSVAYEDHLKSHPECQYYNHDRISTSSSSSVVNGQKFSCHLCSFTAADALAFYRHRLSHMFNNKSQYSCVLCSKPFADLKAFMEHSMEHQNSMASQTLHINWLQHFSNHYQSLLMTGNTEAYQNPGIGQLSDVYQREFSVKARNHSMKDLSEIETLERRAKRKHEHLSASDLGSFKTDNGDSSSPGPAQFKMKKMAFSGSLLNEANNSPLDGCNSGEDNVFESSPINLKMERPSENEDNATGPHQCGICQRWFNTFDSLDNHCLEEHNRSACMFCSKTFAQRANRDRHLCLHTGKKPYNCSDCEEKFSRGDKLKMHRIKVHGAVYPSRTKDPEVGAWIGGNPLRNLEFQHSNASLSPSQDCFEANNSVTHSVDQPSHDIIVDDPEPEEVATRDVDLTI